MGVIQVCRSKKIQECLVCNVIGLMVKEMAGLADVPLGKAPNPMVASRAYCVLPGASSWVVMIG